jgi:hypothetical protein
VYSIHKYGDAIPESYPSIQFMHRRLDLPKFGAGRKRHKVVNNFSQAIILDIDTDDMTPGRFSSVLLLVTRIDALDLKYCARLVSSALDHLGLSGGWQQRARAWQRV